MGLFERIGREYRFLRGVVRVMGVVNSIEPDSGTSICDDFEAAVDRFADHTAILFEDQVITYRHLDGVANRFAAWAEAQKIERGQTVALLLPNRGEYVAAWMGLAKRGIATALINTNLIGAALAHCISIANAQHIITDASLMDALESIRPQLQRPIIVWALDAEGPMGEGRHAIDLHTPRLPPLRPDRSVRAGLKSRDTALYIFTSGTTGMPKAAKITHVRAQLYMRAFRSVTGVRSDDRLYCALPLYHSTGGLCGVGAALFNGATLVLKRKFSASQFWDDMVRYGCTVFVYIGELCRYLVNHPPQEDERAHRLRLAFGNGLRPEVWTQFQERFNVPEILEFYGSTEGNVSLFNFDGKPGAIGRVPGYLKKRFPVRLVKFDVEAEEPVRSPDGLCVECAVGETGEAIGLIGADARSEFAGYADKTASERKILRDVFVHGDAWFRTGDLLKQDDEGYYYFIDRIGDTFRWKGENVSTTEIAEALAHMPGVAEAIVYGVKIERVDGRAGMVAITPGEGFDLKHLHDTIDQSLPSYARPLFIRVQPEAETTGTFKYRKVDLVNEGFDPSKTEHKIYFDDPESKAYLRVTPVIYAKIQSGGYKL